MTSMRDTNLAYKPGEHPVHGTWLSVDVVAITEDSPSKVVLITRQGHPHKGATTLPGGLLAAWDGETVEDAARRIVREKVGVEVHTPVAVLDVVSDPDRDERGHTVSVLVAMRVPAGTPGAVAVGSIPEGMPFRHTEMLRRGLMRIRERVLVERDTSLALLGVLTTVRAAIDLFALCSPKTTDTAVRSRLDRCPIYARDDDLLVRTRIGRPQAVYRLLPSRPESR